MEGSRVPAGRDHRPPNAGRAAIGPVARSGRAATTTDGLAEGEASLSIYKASEIYGQDATELSPELFRCWGRGLARQLAPQAKFVVGGDVRRSTRPCWTPWPKGWSSRA